MKKCRPGTSGLEVSAVGLGCMGTSFSYGPAAGRQEMIRLLRTAVERGATLLDTAAPFSPLGRGFLTGTVDENTTFDRADLRSSLPRCTPEARRANRAPIDRLHRVAAAKRVEALTGR